MMVSHAAIYSFLAFLWMSFNMSLAEEPTFTYSPTEKEDEELSNQFIAQFKRNKNGEESKQSLFSKLNDDDDDGPKLIRRIDSRNISVLKFRSKQAATGWLRNAKGIKYFEMDSMVYLHEDHYVSSPNKQRISSLRKLAEATPYGIAYVNAEDVPDDNSGSRKVCVIDSGYDKTHEDLPDDPAIVTGESFVTGKTWDMDGNGHGTHVAGTIAAIGGNDIGVKGVIRNGQVKLHIVKVFGASGGTSTSTVIAAYEKCIEAGANIINMSLGGGPYLSSFQDAINDGHGQGILTFASSGNSGIKEYNYPASYDHVTSVASIDSSRTRSSFSTYNDRVDICAPGSDVLSTIPGNGYDFYSGTSMASPHAAGVAALVWSNFPSIPAEQVLLALESTATDLPLNSNNGKDIKYGYGLIDAKAAYDALSNGSVTSFPTPAPTPTAEFCQDGIKVLVNVQTDLYATEMYWLMRKNVNGNIMKAHFPDYYGAIEPFQFFTDEFCLAKTNANTCSGRDYTFTIGDLYGDGICCSIGFGYYEVFVDDELLVRGGGDFALEESTSLCKEGDDPEEPLPPSAAPTEFFCHDDDGIEVQVNVQTDDYGYVQNFWEITNANGEVVADKRYFGNNALQTDYVCLEKTENCLGSGYTFTMYDFGSNGLCCTYGNGYYEVYVGGELVGSGGEFGGSSTRDLCTFDGKEPSLAPSDMPSENKTPSAAPSLETCESILVRKYCKERSDCSWEVDGAGKCVKATLESICKAIGKRKPCVEEDGCFWKTNDDGSGRCRACTTITKKNNCQSKPECTWNESENVCE